MNEAPRARLPTDPLDCPVADQCGGCALIRQPYAQQLETKHQRAVEIFGRYPELSDVTVEPVVAAPSPAGYRTRAKLACERDGTGLRVGLYQRGSHQVVDVGDCPVLHPAAREVVAAVRDVFSRPRFAALPLTYISVRYSRSEERSHLTFVLHEDAPELALAAAEVLGAQVPSLAGVTLNLNPGPPLRVFGPTFRHLTGDERLAEEVGARRFDLSPGSFFQTNAEQLDAIVSLLRSHCEPASGRLVDFYAGAGVLALSVAPPDAEVVAVEGYDAAAQDARQAAALAGFDRFRMVAAPAERTAAALAEEVGEAAVVLVNPPRKGCAPAVLRALVALGPERAAYVSCDASTLARDLAVLARLGMEATRLIPVDMLPQTDHLEVVALLEPRRGDDRRAPMLRVLHEDDSLLVVDKPPHVPVHSGQGTALTVPDLLARERGEEARTYLLVHRLDAETSGVLVLAKNRETAARLSDSFARGEVGKRYLCLARGIVRKKGVVNRPLAPRGEKPQPARTRYRQILLLKGHSLVAVTPETGRMHQIRRHLADLDHPIIGDGRYGDPATNRHFTERYAVGRHLLHAAALSFTHPTTSERLTVWAPMPADFAEVLARLGLQREIDVAGLARGLAAPGGGAPPRRTGPPGRTGAPRTAPSPRGSAPRGEAGARRDQRPDRTPRRPRPRRP